MSQKASSARPSKEKYSRTDRIASFTRRPLAAGLLVFFLSFSGCERNEKLEQKATLGSYRDVGEFSLIDQNGEAFSQKAVEGKVWVANFIFTSCATECPILTMQLAKIRKRLDAEEVETVPFISLSVDPETDRPERLKDYAERFGAGGEDWRFATGEPEALETLIKDRFLQPLAESEGAAAAVASTRFIHSNRLAVVDRSGTVRFYVDGLKPESVPLTLDAVRQLLVESESGDP